MDPDNKLKIFGILSSMLTLSEDAARKSAMFLDAAQSCISSDDVKIGKEIIRKVRSNLNAVNKTIDVFEEMENVREKNRHDAR